VDASQELAPDEFEEVVRLQPDYLVFAASHAESAARDFEALSVLPAGGSSMPWRNSTFRGHQRGVNRPAPRIVSAIEDLARQLHPSAFQDALAPEKPRSPCATAVQSSRVLPAT